MKNPVRLNAGRGETAVFLRRVIRYIVERIVLPPGNLSMTLVNDGVIREINHRYRRIDRATDVLTFCLNEQQIWGDVYISTDTVRRNARRHGVSFESELAWVVSHAFAHALGYDHPTPRKRSIMKDFEEYLLKGFPIHAS